MNVRLLAMVGTATLALAATGSASAQNVTYTEAQATQGAASYGAECSRCHGKAAEGAEAPALTGPQFDASWRGGPVKALTDYIFEQMPEDKPKSLKADNIAAITAYLMKANKIPAGADPLPASPPAAMMIPK
jgi:S-disulfanyl-L-cysteine oxidoreductase SoxD